MMAEHVLKAKRVQTDQIGTRNASFVGIEDLLRYLSAPALVDDFDIPYKKWVEDLLADTLENLGFDAGPGLSFTEDGNIQLGDGESIIFEYETNRKFQAAMSNGGAFSNMFVNVDEFLNAGAAFGAGWFELGGPNNRNSSINLAADALRTYINIKTLNSSDANKEMGFLIQDGDVDKFEVVDDLRLKGMEYKADYSAAGKLLNRWIPDWKAVMDNFLKKLEADSRTGTLTQFGQLIINDKNALRINTGEDGSASSNVVAISNTNGGGLFLQRRGSITVRARGDSLTDYYILQLQNNSSTPTNVFAVIDTNGYTEIGRSGVPLTSVLLKVFGKVEHADATNPQESATLGQVLDLVAGAGGEYDEYFTFIPATPLYQMGFEDDFYQFQEGVHSWAIDGAVRFSFDRTNGIVFNPANSREQFQVGQGAVYFASATPSLETGGAIGLDTSVIELYGATDGYFVLNSSFFRIGRTDLYQFGFESDGWQFEIDDAVRFRFDRTNGLVFDPGNSSDQIVVGNGTALMQSGGNGMFVNTSMFAMTGGVGGVGGLFSINMGYNYLTIDGVQWGLRFNESWQFEIGDLKGLEVSMQTSEGQEVVALEPIDGVNTDGFLVSKPLHEGTASAANKLLKRSEVVTEIQTEVPAALNEQFRKIDNISEFVAKWINRTSADFAARDHKVSFDACYKYGTPSDPCYYFVNEDLISFLPVEDNKVIVRHSSGYIPTSINTNPNGWVITGDSYLVGWQHLNLLIFSYTDDGQVLLKIKAVSNGNTQVQKPNFNLLVDLDFNENDPTPGTDSVINKAFWADFYDPFLYNPTQATYIDRGSGNYSLRRGVNSNNYSARAYLEVPYNAAAPLQITNQITVVARVAFPSTADSSQERLIAGTWENNKGWAIRILSTTNLLSFRMGSSNGSANYVVSAAANALDIDGTFYDVAVRFRINGTNREIDIYLRCAEKSIPFTKVANSLVPVALASLDSTMPIRFDRILTSSTTGRRIEHDGVKIFAEWIDSETEIQDLMDELAL